MSDDTGTRYVEPELPPGRVVLDEDQADLDVLFDPFGHDLPLDLNKVRADDALIDALGSGDLQVAAQLTGSVDPLIALIASWAVTHRSGTEHSEVSPGESDEHSAAERRDRFYVVRVAADKQVTTSLREVVPQDVRRAVHIVRRLLSSDVRRWIRIVRKRWFQRSR